MTYNSKLTALHKGLTPIHPDQDRINFAPKLAEDIRVRYVDPIDGEVKFLEFNKVYTSSDTYFPELDGTVWTISDIEGWWNLSDPEVPDIQRGFGDGSFSIYGRNLARNMTLSGSIIIQSNDRTTIAAKSKIARQILLNAFNLVKKSTWLIVDERPYITADPLAISTATITSGVCTANMSSTAGIVAGSLVSISGMTAANGGSMNGIYQVTSVSTNNSIQFATTKSGAVTGLYKSATLVSDDTKLAAQVWLSGRPEISTVNSRGRIDFSIGLRAPDPIKYEWIDTDPTGFPAGELITGNGYNYGYFYDLTVSYLKAKHYDELWNSTVIRYYDTSEIYDGSVKVWTYDETFGSIYDKVQGTVSAYNYGTSNVYMYLRLIGPLYGPAVIKNTSTDPVQTITFLTPEDGSAILGPTWLVHVDEFVDIDTRSREVHKGVIEGGVATEGDGSSRGILEPLIDWIYLQPGDNQIYFESAGVPLSTSQIPALQVYWRSGWDG